MRLFPSSLAALLALAGWAAGAEACSAMVTQVGASC
jgi:hypothetical protein